jgi:nucleoside-diphosphate-sugar epimerase
MEIDSEDRMRILLTGANGFIGRHLRAALLDEGFELVCAVRRPCHSANPRLRYIEADMAKDTSKASWLARVREVDVVINGAGIFRQTRSARYDSVHRDGPRALFAACADAGVRLVIQLSALGADSQARSAYHRSKKAADDFLASLPLRAVIVQPSLVYGPDGRSARLFKALASMPLLLRFGHGPQLVQPIHVDDVVSAIVRLVQLPAPGPAAAQTIALVGPAPMSFTDYIAALRTAMGMGKLRVLNLPQPLARALARCAGMLPASLLDFDSWQMLERGNTADPAPTRGLIGRPARPVAQFIAVPAAERALAKLTWLLPLLRLSIAVVWIVASLVSLGPFPLAASYELLARTGVAARAAPVLLNGAAALDLTIGLGILFMPRRRPLWLLQMALIAVYSALIAWKLPEFLVHPYGPIVKNLPILAAAWMLYELEES